MADSRLSPQMLEPLDRRLVVLIALSISTQSLPVWQHLRIMPVITVQISCGRAMHASSVREFLSS